ncbi:hypothetical protein Efla_005194 [Eimeria flavescens]
MSLVLFFLLFPFKLQQLSVSSRRQSCCIQLGSAAATAHTPESAPPRGRPVLCPWFTSATSLSRQILPCLQLNSLKHRQRKHQQSRGGGPPTSLGAPHSRGVPAAASGAAAAATAAPATADVSQGPELIIAATQRQQQEGPLLGGRGPPAATRAPAEQYAQAVGTP